MTPYEIWTKTADVTIVLDFIYPSPAIFLELKVQNPIQNTEAEIGRRTIVSNPVLSVTIFKQVQRRWSIPDCAANTEVDMNT